VLHDERVARRLQSGARALAHPDAAERVAARIAAMVQPAFSAASAVSSVSATAK
jgi:hypothetical protein